MKFEDLSFKPMSGFGEQLAIQATVKFRNGSGASIVRHYFSYGGRKGLYELAVFKEGADGFDSICYDTPITTNALGWLSENEVTETLIAIEKLRGHGFFKMLFLQLEMRYVRSRTKRLE